MKDLNKKTGFEKRWEEVFQEAEITPPESVWSKIDSTLSKEEAGYFKKRAFMFKMLAAASIAFAMGIGIFSLNYYLDNSNQTETVQSQQPTNVNKNNDGTLAQEEVGLTEVTDASTAIVDVKKEQSEYNSSLEEANEQSANHVAANESLPGSVVDKALTTGLTVEANIAEVGSIAFNAETNVDGVNEPESQMLAASLNELFPMGIGADSEEELYYEIDHIYLIPVMPRGASKIKRENDAGALMASVDFSAGQFDPNFQQGASSFATPNASNAFGARTELTSFNATNKDFLQVRSSGQQTKPEVAFSYGANVGFMVSKRFLVQTGVAYRKANTTTTTTGYFENAESNTRVPIVASYQYKLGGLSSVNRIDETNLNNQYEFASIPIRAGYIIINRKINLTLLAGISSEFFINNSIVDKSNFLQTISSDDASDSPYKNVYFNGSLGTMLGYTFAGNYMVTVEPSYRVAINSFTKDSFYLSSYPSSFMVSFGVAYNFK